MALTPDQKIQVQKKVKQLQSEGINTQDAIKQAFNEISPTALADQLAAKSPGAKAARIQENLPAKESLKLNEEITKARAKFVSLRKDELQSSGYSPEESKAIADREANDAYGGGLESTFDEFDERRGGTLFDVIDTTGIKSSKSANPTFISDKEKNLILESFRPQTTGPSDPSDIEAQKKLLSADTNPLAAEVSWDKIKKDLISQGATEEQANKQIIGIKAVYENVYKDESKNKDVRAASNAALSRALEEIGSFETASKKLIKPEDYQGFLEKKYKEQPDKIDVYAEAFGEQIRTGKGVPDFSPAQMVYFQAINEQEKEAARKKKETETKKVYTIQEGKNKGKVLSEAEYRNYLQGLREDSARPKIAQSNAPKTPAEIQAELDKEFEIPWYLQEEKKKAYLSDPTKFTEKSLTQETDIFGGTKETTAGQISRGALSAWNALAGAVFPTVFEGGANIPFTDNEGRKETQAEIEERKRERRPLKYKDSPILYNIAENRGYYAQGKEVSDILDLGRYQPLGFEPEGTYSAIYQAGTFAADILDPALDLVTGAGAGIRTLSRADKLKKAAGGLSKISGPKEALKAAYNTALDSSLVGNLAKGRFKTANIRSAIVSDINSSLSASQKITKNVEAGEDALKGLSKSEAASAYATDFKAKKTAGVTEADAVNALRAENKALIEQADDISKGLDELVAGRSSKLSNKNVAKVLGAMASQDDALKVILRNIDNAPAEGITKISQYVAALDETRKTRLKSGLLYDVAADTVLAATKGDSILDNLVALTRNTFVNKSSVDEILKASSETSFGKLVKKLSEAPLEFKPSFGSARISVIVPDALKEELKAEIRTLRSGDRISGNMLKSIESDLSRGFITSDDLRYLIDRNIEAVAENIVQGKNVGLLRAKDVSKLDQSKALDLLVPLENRSFSRETLKEILLKFQGKYLDKPSNAAIGQQRLLSEAVSRGSTMDVVLRTSMQKLMDKGSAGRAFRKAYGIDPVKPLTKQEALAYAIRGTSFNKDSMEKVLRFAANNLFYTKQTKQNLFDLFSGLDVSKTTSIFTPEGQKVLDGLIASKSAALEAAPEKLWEVINDLRIEIKQLIDDASPMVGDISRDKNFSVDPKDILSFEGSKVAAGGLPDVIPVSLFYKAEAERIQKELILNLLEEEAFRNGFKATSLFDKDYVDYANKQLSKFGSSTESINKNLIYNRLEKRLEGAFDETASLSNSDIKNIFNTTDSVANSIKTDSQVKAVLDNLTDGADNIVKSVISKNKIHNKATLEDISNTINKATSSPEEAAKFKLLFGEDAGDTVAANLSKGFENIKKTLTDELILNNSSTWNAGLLISRLFDYVNDLRYTFLLNLRPRFHGANIATGSDIYYQTTGKLPNPFDIATGASLPIMQAKRPFDIVLTDKAGRSYTASEVYERLMQQGGQSIYSLNAPKLASDRILALTTDSELDGVKKWWNSFKNLPQAEDMAFRYAAFSDAIRSGRSIEEATALARKAMFDAGDLADWEKNIQKLLMFYGFRRNNFVNFAKNLASPQGISRIKNFLRTKDASEDTINEFLTDLSSDQYLEEATGISKEDRKKLPQYLEGKLVLGKIPGKEKDVIVTSPSLATLDAFSIFAEAIKGNIFKLTADMANPNYKVIFGMDQGMGRTPTKIMPEHVVLMDKYGLPTSDVVNFLAGSEVTPRKASEETGAVGGVIYPLTQPSQQARYKKFVDTLSFIGLSTFINDYSKARYGEGTAARKLSGSAAIAQAIGFLTSSYAIPPEKADYFNKLAKLKELQKSIGAMGGAVKKEEVKIEDPKVAAQIAETAAEKASDRAEVLVDTSVNEGQKLVAEYNNLISQLSKKAYIAYAEKYGEDAADAEFERLEIRMEELEKKMDALGIDY